MRDTEAGTPATCWTELALLWRPEATTSDVHLLGVKEPRKAAFAIALGEALGRLHSRGVLIDAQPGNFLLAPDGDGLIFTDISFPVIQDECNPTDFAALARNLIPTLKRQSPAEWGLFKTGYVNKGGPHAADLVRWIQEHEAAWWIEGGHGRHALAIEAINEAIRSSREPGRTIILLVARARQQLHLGHPDEALASCHEALAAWDATFDDDDRAEALSFPIGEHPLRAMQALHTIAEIDEEAAQAELARRRPRLIETDAEWRRFAETPSRMHGPEEAIPDTPSLGSVASMAFNEKAEQVIVCHHDGDATLLAAIAWPNQVLRWQLDITGSAVLAFDVHGWIVLQNGTEDGLRLVRADAREEPGLRSTVLEPGFHIAAAAALPGDRIALLGNGRYVELDRGLRVCRELALPEHLRVGFQIRGVFPLRFSASQELLCLVFEHGFITFDLLAPTEAAMVLTDALQPVGLRPAGPVPNPIDPLALAVTTDPDDPRAVTVMEMAQFTVEVAVWQPPRLWLFGFQADRLWCFDVESAKHHQLAVSDIWVKRDRPQAGVGESTVAVLSNTTSWSGRQAKLVELSVGTPTDERPLNVTVRQTAETKAAVRVAPGAYVGVRSIRGRDYLRPLLMHGDAQPLHPVTAVGLGNLPIKQARGPLESFARGTWSEGG